MSGDTKANSVSGARWWLLLGFVLASAVLADDLARPVVAAEDCVAMLERERTVLALRVTSDCAVSEEALNRVLDAGFAAASDSGHPLRSIFLGRLVRYPALAAKLVAAASRSSEWDSSRGKPNAGHANALVARLVAESGAVAAVAGVIGRHGYAVQGVSVEKVLVQDAARLPPEIANGARGRLPFDALVWVNLARRGAR